MIGALFECYIVPLLEILGTAIIVVMLTFAVTYIVIFGERNGEEEDEDSNNNMP